MSQLKEIDQSMKLLATPERAVALSRYFKTGAGQYGEGDIFIGITVPELRKLAANYKDVDINDIEKLITSEIHEKRLLALILLVNKFKISDETSRSHIYMFYINHLKFINNWDLVDTSAPKIVGAWLNKRNKEQIYKLARSDNLWEKRVAILSTFYFINNGDSEDALKIAEMLIFDEHDLIQKAVGWMLREIGKRCSLEIEKSFLNKYYQTMPRTTLRYAIEHFPEVSRVNYLKGMITTK